MLKIFLTSLCLFKMTYLHSFVPVEMPFLEDSNAFFVMNDNFIVLPTEKALLESLRNKQSGFQSIKLNEIKSLSHIKQKTVEVRSFLDLDFSQNFLLKDSALLFVPPKGIPGISDELFLSLDFDTKKKDPLFPSSLTYIDGFAYLGSSLKFKKKPSTSKLHMKEKAFNSKDYPLFSDGKKTFWSTLRGHEIYVHPTPSRTYVLIKTKSGNEYFISGTIPVKGNSLFVTEWIENYSAFNVSEETRGNCQSIIFVNEKNAYQVKLPCRF